MAKPIIHSTIKEMVANKKFQNTLIGFGDALKKYGCDFKMELYDDNFILKVYKIPKGGVSLQFINKI